MARVIRAREGGPGRRFSVLHITLRVLHIGRGLAHNRAVEVARTGGPVLIERKASVPPVFYCNHVPF